MDYVLYRAHEYLYMRKKYLTIPLDFLTIFVDYSLIFMKSWYSVSNIFIQIDGVMTKFVMPSL